VYGRVEEKRYFKVVFVLSRAQSVTEKPIAMMSTVKTTIPGKRALFIVLSMLAAAQLYAQSSLRLSFPEIFVKLDTTCMTPDAMAFDGAGNIYLSITNATSYDRFGAKIIKLSPTGKVLATWTALPKHSASGKVHPMGIAIAPDGFVYIADNQSFAGQKHKSRVLRARLQNGEIRNFETVVSGLNVANGLRYYRGYIYVTDAWTDNERKSGIYRFNTTELNSKPVTLDIDNRGQYLIHEMELDKNIPNGVGADGLDFDASGNLYVGNFGNGTITKITPGNGTSGQEVTRLIKDNVLTGCDGILFDRSSNSLLIANFLHNSILQYELSTNKLSTLWRNDDALCNANLDCPCDLAIINNKLIVVNFDTYTTPANKTLDNCNTLSSFNILR